MHITRCGILRWVLLLHGRVWTCEMSTSLDMRHFEATFDLDDDWPPFSCVLTPYLPADEAKQIDH